MGGVQPPNRRFTPSTLPRPTPTKQDEADAAAFVDNDPYAKAGLFASTFVTQLAELDVTGQHLDRQWEKFQLEGT